jgi:single-strand DNA-binding protein
MNFLQLMGHLGADPETRMTPKGQKVTNLRLAVTSRRQGQEETMWWRVTLWGDKFDRILPYLKKGSALIVNGEMKKPEIFNGRDGQPQVGLEMTAETLNFPPFGRKENQPGEERVQQQPAAESNSFESYGSAATQGAEEDEPIPF